MDWLYQLRSEQQRGSRPRCLLLTEGDKHTVAERLTNLIDRDNVKVGENDIWMPRGIPIVRPDGKWDSSPIIEAELGKSEGFLSPEQRRVVTTWWLSVIAGATTPTWDVASTCTIGQKNGLLLVEAKAHTRELVNEENGKPLEPDENRGVSANRRRNHIRIGMCLAEANIALAGETRLPWALSRDWCYQMSNRFAWAWKVVEMGIPVVLIYLGFLNADEMKDTFANHGEWAKILKEHSCMLFPTEVWGQQWNLHGQQFVPLIRSIEQPLTMAP